MFGRTSNACRFLLVGMAKLEHDLWVANRESIFVANRRRKNEGIVVQAEVVSVAESNLADLRRRWSNRDRR